jgi:hypothetical protein
MRWLWLLVAAWGAVAQDRVIGEVTAITPSEITVRSDAGTETQVVLQDGTTFLRVAPGAKDLAGALKISLLDVSRGDRVLVRGRATTPAAITAASIVVMAKTELAQKQESDRAAWRERGIVGVVTTVNSAAREISIVAGSLPIVIDASNAAFKRYSAESPRYSDAKLSSIDEIRPGDQVRALGGRPQEGGKYVAREIVSGVFRNIAGTVASVDASTGTVTVNDLASGRPVAVRIVTDSLVRRLPPPAAMMLARRVHGTEAAPGAPRPDLQQMLERLPGMPITDLKPGEAVIVASTGGGASARFTAVALLAGVETLLAGAPRGADPLGGRWDFSADLAAGGPQ